MQNSNSIDDYIKKYPVNVQEILQKFREVIKKQSPQAIEVISYGVPTFKLNGKNLVHFAAFKDHYSFFPTSSPRQVFKKELSKYAGGKGTIIFPLDIEIPWDLIKKITEFRVKELSK